VEVHVGAVEERVADAKDRDVAPRVEVLGELDGAAVVELTKLGLVPTRMGALLGCHREGERQLDLLRPQVRLGHGARDAAAVLGARVGDHVGGLDHATCLDRHQLGVAGPDADPKQLARARH
jgi:hypothetical protein